MQADTFSGSGGTVRPAKPKLRGWLHAAMFPVAVAVGIVLIVIAPTLPSRIASVIFTVTAALLFGTSAVYHRGTWSGRVAVWMRRWDHSNIFLIIAGTYTPVALLLLPTGSAEILLTIIWSAAAAGIAFRIFWVGAPRWLYVPVYVGMAVAGIGYLPAFFRASPAAGALLLAGGACYVLGAIVYGFKRPDPAPRYFGFHEVFHSLTIAGFLTQYAGILVAAV
ncbi:PAQR family membrane homeostasis protein TrhA [Spelaeicoccus albus]|uniref:Hemolysin III n=1 Tax=Spelaeicoccus albus TaxID=1280376 RepID=A0A7Z0D369_9MICO|nr:hemolysin III family protein [Spelaeicoccus albus]NYI67996.1 hemolysin III [Spelaeicoccus albus]